MKFDNCIYDLKSLYIYFKNYIESSFVCRFESVIKYINVLTYYNGIEVFKICFN